MRLIGILLVAVVTACAVTPPEPNDLPFAGTTYANSYKLDKVAGQKDEVNMGTTYGVNENVGWPYWVVTTYKRQPTVKIQTVELTPLSDGVPRLVHRMVARERFAGVIRNISVEEKVYDTWSLDRSQHRRGVTVRMKFVKFGVNYTDPSRSDFEALFRYYPDEKEELKLQVLALMQVFTLNPDARGKGFNNYGWVVSLKGEDLAKAFPPFWWTKWNSKDAEELTTEVVLDQMRSYVSDLERHRMRELGWHPGYVYYYAGDADTYLHADRAIFNRQAAYPIGLRLDPERDWSVAVVQPLYDLPWNDLAGAVVKNLVNSWKNRADEMQRWVRQGWPNTPNRSLDQVVWWKFDEAGNKYPVGVFTVRAWHGTVQSLLAYNSKIQPPVMGLWQKIEIPEYLSKIPKPVKLDASGKVVLDTEKFGAQDENAWQAYLREIAFAEYWQHSLQSDWMGILQYADTSVLDYITEDGVVIAIRRAEPHLNVQIEYRGDYERLWVTLSTLGEAGMRVLGFSYASDVLEGNGLYFALGQRVLTEQIINNRLEPWSPFILDARANLFPEILGKAWDNWRIVQDWQPGWAPVEEKEHPEWDLWPTATPATPEKLDLKDLQGK